MFLFCIFIFILFAYNKIQFKGAWRMENKSSFLLTSEERTYLENKYHRTDRPFNAYNRMAHHGYDYDESTGLSDEAIDEKLAILTKSLQDKPHAIIKAHAVACVLDHTRIDVNENDYYPGLYSWGRLIDKHTISVWLKEAREKTKNILGENVLDDLSITGTAYCSLDDDHTVPDFDSLLNLGFSGILHRVEKSYDTLKAKSIVDEKQETFYEAVCIEYRAILRFIDRLYEYSLTKTNQKSAIVSSALKRLREGAPTNTYEVLLLIYLYFMISESVEHYQVRALGYGLDNTLYPFYKRDLNNGTFTETELHRFIAFFLMQFSAMGNYWGQPMYLGGTNKDGSTKVNKLSYLFLEIYEKLDIYNPKLQIKVSPATPKKFLLKAYDMIRSGANSIVFINEETMIKALMHQGATYDKAQDGIIKGCYEYATKADSLCISFNTFNALKPISLVFNNGIDQKTKIEIGAKTGDVSLFTSFEEFYEAYRTQFIFSVQKTLNCISVYESFIHDVNPSTLYSGTIPQCVNTLKDANDGGIKNISSMWLNGLASAVDSLMAVYELVFERKITTLKELKTALDNNWDGYAELRNSALRCRHKYGIGDEIADYYANAIHQLYSAQFSNRKNSHGGNFEYELHSALAFLYQGEKTEATPDGRKYGQETSKNASPTPGMDKNGVTALINSVTKMDLSLADSGACLDVMLHPTSVQGEDGLVVLQAVLNTYMKKGGASIHFNIFNAETLRDAQKNPQNYKNLQVRVCGWNVLWNNMNKKEQDAYIFRAENIAK